MACTFLTRGLASAQTTTATDLCAPAANPCVVSIAVQVVDGSVIDVGNRELRIASGGTLSVGSGSMTLIAATLTVQAQGMLRARGNASNSGGLIEVQAEHIVIQGTVDGVGAPGGRIELTASGELAVSGRIDAGTASSGESGGDIALTGAVVTVSGSVVAAGGSSSDAGPLGGTINIRASRDVTVSGTLDVRGAEGGFLELSAGAGSVEGGNLTIAASAQVTGDANTTGGAGGDIEINAMGDGVTSGNVHIAGPVSSVGSSGSFDAGGGFGGAIEVSASGNVTTEIDATLDVRGGGPDGSGGSVDVIAVGGFDAAGKILIGAAGSESEGGELRIEVGSDVFVRGSIDGSAGSGGGGEVQIDSHAGEVSLLSTIDVDSNAPGPSTFGRGGTISVGGFAEPVSLVVGQALSADGSGRGPGGVIELHGRNVVQLSGPLTGNGGNQGGHGGTHALSAESGMVVVGAPVTARGLGTDGSGGQVSIDAKSGISILAQVDVRGEGGSAKFCELTGLPCVRDEDCTMGRCATAGGGSVVLASTGAVDILAAVLASSAAGGGGRLAVRSEGDVRIAASIATDGVLAPGGEIDALGCSVLVCGLDAPACPPGTGSLSSLGPSGTNVLTGRGRGGALEPVVNVLGNATADSNGGNVLVWPGTPEALRPAVFGTADPAPILVADVSLLPCPLCGNRSIEVPETCDDGNQNDGDGCSSSCQLEPGFTLTPTPTATSTATTFTATATTMPTATRTPTPTITPTSAPSSSFTPTPTSSLTPTPTSPFTPTPTSSFTSTPTSPFTPTPTSTATAVGPDDFAYVVSFGNPDSVRVIDTQTDTLTPLRIDLPLGGQFVSITPDGRFAYVSGSNGVTVVDTARATVVRQLTASNGIERPSGRVAFHPDGSQAYIVNGRAPALSVIDTATHQVVDTISLGGAIGNGDPGGIGVTPDGIVYVTPLLLDASSSIAAVDVARRAVVGTIASPCDLAVSQDLAVAPDGQRVYVPLFGCRQSAAGGAGAIPACSGDCDGNDMVTVGEVITSINVALGVFDPGVCPGLNRGGEAVRIDALIDAVDASLHGCIPVVPPLNGNGLAVVDTNRNRIFVVVPFGRIGPSLEANAVQTLGGLPQVNGTGIDLTPDGRFAYIAGCDIPNLVCVVDTRNGTVTARIAAFDTGQVAFDVAITPDGRLAYVTQSTRSQVAVIDLRTNTIADSLFIPENRGVAAGRRSSS